MNRASYSSASIILTGFFLFAISATADPVDKGQYHLFHPTPAELMRELSPDRPDRTESPYTVDAGHFQLEMDFANFTADDDHGTKVRAWNVAPINFKVGLLNSVDLQLIFDSYIHQRTETSGGNITQSGIGDFTVRTKINLWGNDGGKTAFALLPFLKLPTNTDGLGNNAVEGGLILPLAIELPAGFGLGLETGASGIRDESGNGYHAEIVNSITIGHDIAGKLSGYVEFFSNLSTEKDSDWEGTVDVGFIYSINNNIALDFGCNFGVTESADDWNPFVGLTARF